MRKIPAKKLIMACATLLLAACGNHVVLNVQAVDESGAPVPGAEIKGFFYTGQVEQNRDSGTYVAITDADGRATIRGFEDIYVKLFATKSGWHNSQREVVVREIVFDPEQTQRIVMRAQRNPVPLHAKRVSLIRQDLQDGDAYAYDLLEGDFVTPHGNGTTPDLQLTYTWVGTDTFNYAWTLHIGFIHEKDGLIPVNFPATDSVFVSDYEAPLDDYHNKWTLHQTRAGVFDPATGNVDRWRSYYFRIRSSVDEEGNVVGHYGKIYGEFPDVVYYVNPSLSDRNIEWHVKQNLFRSLHVAERPVEP